MSSRGGSLALALVWLAMGLANLFLLTADPLPSAVPMVFGLLAGMNFAAAALLPERPKVTR